MVRLHEIFVYSDFFMKITIYSSGSFPRLFSNINMNLPRYSN
jgi:hypothetical protein